MNTPVTNIAHAIVKLAGAVKNLKPVAPAPAKSLDEVMTTKTVEAFAKEWPSINGSKGRARPATKMPWEKDIRKTKSK